MLRVFQVNVGAFLSLREDVQPSQRVLDLQEEVCHCLRVSPPEVVLMTPDGQQMEPARYIASYTSGTESRPIFAFNRAVLQRPHAPQILPMDINDAARAPGLDEAWRKPHALLQLIQGFESQAGQLNSYFGELLVEQELQVRAWLAVQRNCRGILETFKKQAEGLHTEHSCVQSKLGSWRELVLQFPQTLDLLHKVVIPPSLSSAECGMALDEWISQQDPHSRLRDLAEDCRRALNNVFDDSRSEELLRTAQQTTEAIGKESEGIPGWKDRLERLCVYRDELKKTADVQLELAKNVKVTLENALRSGERTVLEDLKEAQQQTVLLMRQNDRKARELVQQCFKSKKDLAEYLHGRLRGVSDMQRKMAETSKSLVLLREQLKLLRKKMAILCQICEAPQVLVEIMAEIVRRQKFTESFAKMSLSYEQALKEWRAHEKSTRQSFLTACGDHFLIRLFPTAAEKPGPPRRLELDQAELVGRPLLALEQAHVALKDLPEGLKESFQIKSQVSLPTALSWEASVSPLVQEAKQQEGGQEREDVEQQVSRLSQERSELEETVREHSKGLQELREERDALRVELEGQRQAHSELQAARNTAERELESRLSVSVQEERQRSALVHRVEELEARVVSLQEDKDELSRQLQEKVASLHAQMGLQAKDLSEVRAEREKLLAELSQNHSAAAREAVALQREVEAVTQSHKEECTRSEELERSLSELRADLDVCSEELRQEQARSSVLRRTLEGQTESLGSLVAALGTLAQEMHTLGRSLCTAEVQDTKPPPLLEARDVSSLVPVVSAMAEEAGGLCQQAAALRATLVEAVQSNVDFRAHLEELEDEKRQAKEELEDEKRKQSTEKRGTAEVIAGLEGRVGELECERDQLLREMELSQVEVVEHLRQSSRQQQEMEEEKQRLEERVQCLQQSVHESETQQARLKTDLEELEAKGREMEKELSERCQQHARAVNDLTAEMQRVCQLEVRFAEAEAARQELKLTAEKDLDRAKVLQASLAKQLAESEEQHSRDLARLKAVEGEKASVESKLRSKEADCALQSEQLAALKAQLEKAQLDHLGGGQPPVRAIEKDMATKGQKAALCNTPSDEAKPSPRVPTVARSQDLSELEDRTAGPTHPGLEKIAVRDLQEGDLALFMAHRPRDSSHSKDNYLAITFDGRLYYLDAECAKLFKQDLTYLSTALGKSSRKTYLGRIRSKTLCEVRKVDNRLGVPVGTKLLKVTADESALGSRE